MVEVIVEYDYAAQEPDELTIKKGDIITDVVRRPGGWWEGVLRDRKGMFPDNFVRTFDKDPSSVTFRNKKDVSRIRQCRAVFSYSPLHEDELKLNVGDVINVVGEEEEGWWRGLLNGNEGVFPSNFVEEIVLSPPKPTSREEALSLAGENEPTSPPKLPSKPTKQLCEVKFPYKAQNDDELTLKEGDIITIINKESQDPGWWKGELNGHIGVFPDNFVTIISSGDDKSVGKDDKKISKVNTDTGAIKSTSVASQRKSLEVKTEPKSDRPPASDPISIKTTPPIPGKKPLISIKKSPSSSGSGLFSEIKKKLVDVVDGATGSKISPSKTEGMEVVKDSSTEAFDQVERRPLLTDVRATRAKAPGRRLPNLHKDDDLQPSIPNGNVDHFSDASELPSAPQNNAGPDSDSEKPRLREWEKHKAPWLEEMKLNQAKRTSTSPGPSPEGKNKLTPTGEKGEEKEEKGSPVVEKEREIDMSKSLPPLDLSKSLSVNNKVKTPLNEPEKAPSIKSKPALPAFRQSLSGNVGKENSQTSNYRHSSTPLGVLKDPTPIKPAAPAPPKISPSAAQFSTPLSTTKTNSIATHDSTTVHSQEKEHTSGESSETITFKHYTELLEKIQKLEAMVQKQNYAIEDLRNKLQVETDMRMLLQEKVMQNVQV